MARLLCPALAAAALASLMFAPSAAAEPAWLLHDALGLPAAVRLSGSTRVRYEAIDGQARVGFNDFDDLLSFRTLVLAEYRTGRFRLGGELQDSRAYLSDNGTPLTTSEVNALEPIQAYAADFPGLFGEGSRASLQAGRMTLNLGSRRLVASDDYRNTMSAYTGLRADLRFARGASAVIVSTLPQTRLPEDFSSLHDNEVALDLESEDLQLHGGIATLPLGYDGAALDLTYFRLFERDQRDLATRDRRLHTAGARLYREPSAGRIDFDAEAFGQWGELSASTAAGAPTLDASAHFVHLEAGYQWAEGWKPRLAFEYDYASGDKRGGDYERFDTLFGMRRAEIAPAGLYNAVGRANLDALGLRLEVTPSARLDAFVALRDLKLASDTDSFSTTGARDASGASGD